MVTSCSFLSSCASYSSSAPVMGIKANSINTYVEADLDYANAKRVRGSVESKTLFWVIPLIRNGNKTMLVSNRYNSFSKSERQALYRAKQAFDVDIILEPEFEKESHSWFFGIYKKQNVSVKGWGVKMKGIKEDKHDGGKNIVETNLSRGLLF